jgi:hypothetical protein
MNVKNIFIASGLALALSLTGCGGPKNYYCTDAYHNVLDPSFCNPQAQGYNSGYSYVVVNNNHYYTPGAHMDDSDYNHAKKAKYDAKQAAKAAKKAQKAATKASKAADKASKTTTAPKATTAKPTQKASTPKKTK